MREVRRERPDWGWRWGVLGLGRSGLAALTHLRARGATVVAVDDAPEALAAVRERFPEVETRLATETLPSEAEAWIVAPGIPPTHPLAAGILALDRQWAELDLWDAERRVTTVAVTGTNGKSTVTTWIADLLAAAGFATLRGGNLGTPAVELLGEPADRAVIEVSSFQLTYARRFRGEIAVLTNVAPDHLDWHRDVAEYVAAKRRLFERLDPECVAVLPDELVAAEWVPDDVPVIRFGRRTSAHVRYDDERLYVAWRRHTYERPIPPHLRAEHLREDLAAAVAALLAGGVVPDEAQLAALEPLARRGEVVGTARGVRFRDDSKATNLHAVVAAARAARPEEGRLHLLLGGKEKGLPWGELAEPLLALEAAVYAFGEAGPAIAAALAGELPVTVAPDLPGAFAAATAAVRAGDVVLLAPGTSSFDAYPDYRARSEHFRELVAAWCEEDADA